jgi:hypothetical protein
MRLDDRAHNQENKTQRMNNRAKIAVVLAAIIIAVLVVLYIFSGDAPSAPPDPASAPASAPKIATAAAPGPVKLIMSAPQVGRAQVMAPVLPPAVVGAPGPQAALNLTSAAPPTPEEMKAITNNLRQFGNAAESFMLEKGRTSAGYYDVVGTSTDYYLHVLNPVVGEDYTGIYLKDGDTEVTISTPDGAVITYGL